MKSVFPVEHNLMFSIFLFILFIFINSSTQAQHNPKLFIAEIRPIVGQTHPLDFSVGFSAEFTPNLFVTYNTHKELLTDAFNNDFIGISYKYYQLFPLIIGTEYLIQFSPVDKKNNNWHAIGGILQINYNQFGLYIKYRYAPFVSSFKDKGLYLFGFSYSVFQQSEYPTSFLSDDIPFKLSLGIHLWDFTWLDTETFVELSYDQIASLEIGLSLQYLRIGGYWYFLQIEDLMLSTGISYFNYGGQSDLGPPDYVVTTGISQFWTNDISTSFDIGVGRQEHNSQDLVDSGLDHGFEKPGDWYLIASFKIKFWLF